MEVENSVDSVEQSTQTPEAAPAPQQDVSPQVADTAPEVSAEKADTVASYTPNPEFFVFGEKKKFDEWALPFIKDKETEDKFREMFSAKHGIDRVKQKRDEYLNQFNEVSQKYQQQDRQIRRLSGYIQNNDLASFQKEVGLTNESILKRAQQILAGMENPELMRAEEDRYSAHKRALELEEQKNYYEQNYVQQQVQQREMELEQALARPDVSQVAAQFDARAGRAGAFRDEIIRRGQYYSQFANQDKKVDELLGELMPLFTFPQQPQAPQVQAPAPNVVQAPERKAVIPNVQARGTSPTKKVYKSLDELRAKAAELSRP